MIGDDGQTPILMDFGSTVKARIKVETRSQALMQQVSIKISIFGPAYEAHRISLLNKALWPTELLNYLMFRLDRH
jgi:hypothetical protein